MNGKLRQRFGAWLIASTSSGRIGKMPASVIWRSLGIHKWILHDMQSSGRLDEHHVKNIIVRLARNGIVRVQARVRVVLELQPKETNFHRCSHNLVCRQQDRSTRSSLSTCPLPAKNPKHMINQNDHRRIEGVQQLRTVSDRVRSW